MDNAKLDLIIAALHRLEGMLHGMLHAMAEDMDEDQIELTLDGDACGLPRDPINPL